MVFPCYDKMIQQRYSNDGSGLCQLASEDPIAFRRQRVLAWMIMCDDEARGVELTEVAKDVARMCLATVDGSSKQQLRTENSFPRTKGEDPELFLVIRHQLTKDARCGAGRLHRKAWQLELPRAFVEPQRRECCGIARNWHRFGTSFRPKCVGMLPTDCEGLCRPTTISRVTLFVGNQFRR